jgi:heme-degrading monooxygenase HmoA
VVIRVVHGRVKPGKEGEFHQLMRDVRLPEMRSQEGFVYGKFGRQVQPDGERFLFVSEWRDVASLYNWAGPDLSKPVTLRGAEHLVQDVKVELYEAMDIELHPTPDDEHAPPELPDDVDELEEGTFVLPPMAGAGPAGQRGPESTNKPPSVGGG